MNGKQLATHLLLPMVEEVADWIDGTEKPGARRPKVLALLPNELQSEIALKRAEARQAKEPKAEQLVAPTQVSRATVSTRADP